MASDAKVNAAYDAVLPTLKAEVRSLVPGFIEGQVEQVMGSPEGIQVITHAISIIIDAADALDARKTRKK